MHDDTTRNVMQLAKRVMKRDHVTRTHVECRDNLFVESEAQRRVCSVTEYTRGMIDDDGSVWVTTYYTLCIVGMKVTCC